MTTDIYAPKRIDCFKHRWAFLSNFYPCTLYFEGAIYRSVEHAYQAAKIADLSERRAIMLAPTAGKAKSLGQRVTLRPDWEDVKLNIMRDLIRQKFTWRKDLCKLLLETGEALLIEGNDWGDQFWGWDIYARRGQNWLGRILMEVREQLRSGELGASITMQFDSSSDVPTHDYKSQKS